MDIHNAQAETVELVEQHFPKGECAERGSANVLHAQMWVVFNRLLTQHNENLMSEVVKKLGEAKRANVLTETEILDALKSHFLNIEIDLAMLDSPITIKEMLQMEELQKALDKQTITKSLEHHDMSELDQDCPYCDIHSSCSIHANNLK